MRVLYVDRPAYGRSDAHPNRTLLDWPRDVEALAETLGLDEFAVVGYSGGSSHALACASALSDRVRCAVVVSGVGPAFDDADVAAAVTPTRRIQVERARTDPAGASELIVEEVRAGIDALAAEADHVAGIEDAGLRRRIEAALRETASRGIEGPATDLVLNYLRPWGFRLQDVLVPVFVWHAENDDDVPVGVGRAVAARLRDARPRFASAGGHLLAWTRAEDILRDVHTTRKAT